MLILLANVLHPSLEPLTFHAEMVAKLLCKALTLFLPVAAFCGFGFLATREPTDNALVFRVGYTAIGMSCLVDVGFLIMNTVRK